MLILEDGKDANELHAVRLKLLFDEHSAVLTKLACVGTSCTGCSALLRCRDRIFRQHLPTQHFILDTAPYPVPPKTSEYTRLKLREDSPPEYSCERNLRH